MAHECPECGSLCYCHGDIDDIMLDTEESYLTCEHYLNSSCSGYQDHEYEDDEYEYDPTLDGDDMDDGK